MGDVAAVVVEVVEQEWSRVVRDLG